MTTNQPLNLFATTPKGLELLLVDELRSLGASNVAEKLAGVAFTGDVALAYKACLWSRLANRILLPLTRVAAATPEALYAGVQTIAWDEHLTPTSTLAVHCVSVQSTITHTLFAAQKIKDAIVDQFRAQYGVRPNVARERPDVHVYVYLYRDMAVISLDLSGESLHKRAYRGAGGAAPLKENLAAAILLRAGWQKIAEAGGSLMDPMCGSGTLLIEAAMMAGNIAPGLLRTYFGFLGWKQHNPACYAALCQDAQQCRQQGLVKLPTIIGYDCDPHAIKIAFENIEHAGLLGHIHVEKRDLAAFVAKPNAKPGLVVVNPPYGERLGEIADLQPLYTQLGDQLKQGFTGWQAAVFTGNPDLGKVMGLRAKRYYALFNGALPCKLLLFDVQPIYFIARGPRVDNERRVRDAKNAVADQREEAIQMFVNRLRKNLKHYKRQAKRRGATSYRVYDADLPEYAFAIDIEEDAVYVQEYEAPKTVDPQKVLQRQQQVLAVLPEVLEIAPGQLFFTQKKRI